MKKIWWGISLLFLINCTSSSTRFNQEPEVRVRIIHTLDTLAINFDTEWQLSFNDQQKFFDATDQTIKLFIKDGKIQLDQDSSTIDLAANRINLKSIPEKGTLNISDVPYGVGWWWEGREDRNYEGEIFIYINKNHQFDVIIKLMLEDYLKGVIPYEMGGNSPLEALKAQAVAARSEAIIALISKMYSGPHYDLTSDVECQVFSGNNKRTATSDRAVAETQALILTEVGEPINAYYASNCGGHSELIQNVWPDRPRPLSYQEAFKDNSSNKKLDLSNEDHLRKWIASSPDVYCNPNREVELPPWSQKNFRWERVYSVAELSRMLAGDKDLGKLIEINPIKRGQSGRIYKSGFIFEKGKFTKNTELSIRQLWSPSLRSSCFVVDQEKDKFIIKGAGWGHGVGMCQSGAVAQAKLSRNFQKILKHYYRKAKLTKLY